MGRSKEYAGRRGERGGRGGGLGRECPRRTASQYIVNIRQVVRAPMAAVAAEGWGPDAECLINKKSGGGEQCRICPGT